MEINASLFLKHSNDVGEEEDSLEAKGKKSTACLESLSRLPVINTCDHFRDFIQKFDENGKSANSELTALPRGVDALLLADDNHDILDDSVEEFEMFFKASQNDLSGSETIDAVNAGGPWLGDIIRGQGLLSDVAALSQIEQNEDPFNTKVYAEDLLQ
jgi:hypothetical protein